MRARLGLYYLLLLGAIGGLNPWLAVILDDAGATAVGKSFILAAFPFGVLVAGPAGSWLADRTGREIAVLRAAAGLCVAASVWLVVAAGTGALIGVALATAGLAVARPPLIPVADMVTVDRLGMGPGGYGPVRAFGSVGFIAAALIVGASLDRWPLAPVWVGAGAATGLALLTFTLPETSRSRRPRTSSGGFTAVLTLLKNPVILALCLVATLHRGTIGFYDQFYALHTTDILGLPGWVAGASIALGVALEVGVLVAGHRLLDRFGPMTLILVAVGSQIPRWALTATLTSAGGLIATQILHGVGFGCWWVGGVALVARQAPADLRNTAQGLFVAAGHGVGSFGALGIAAVMLDGPGTSAAFGLLTGVSAVALVVTVAWLRPAVRRAG